MILMALRLPYNTLNNEEHNKEKLTNTRKNKGNPTEKREEGL